MRAAYDKIETRRTQMDDIGEQSSQLQVSQSYGVPVTAPYLIPVIHNATPSCINAPFMAEGHEYRVTSFALQRPYGAVITDNLEEFDVSLHGKALSSHSLFPKGADIVFVEVETKNIIKARLYEKDKGEVEFSKEGLCAAFVAAKLMQKTQEDGAVVSMGGKSCLVEWDGVDGDVTLVSG